MATSSSFFILDTSILVDFLRSGQHQDRMDSLAGIVRISAVVLAELWRGATKPAERTYLRTLEKNHPVLAPSKQNWLDSGELLSQMGQDQGFTAEKLRRIHFDVLIALTARSHGARLVTSNRSDFELIVSYRAAKGLRLEIW
jgi:predicted nucleic acid-binding protein